MKGYIQELDTVRFNYDKLVGNSLGNFNDAKVTTVLYSIFYDICLSPSQALDLLPLREHLFDQNAVLDLPFIYHISPDIRHRSQPFISQLATFLRREGNDAFIFSSTPNSLGKAKEWGDFISENKFIDDDTLINEAYNYYPNVIEWAKKLDSFQSKLRIKPIVMKCSYKDLFSSYIRRQFDVINYIEFSLPISRSNSYQAIVNRSTSPDEISRKKQLPDFISGLQYAVETDSKLIVEQASNIFIEEELGYCKFADISIDIKGLISEYPSLEKGIIGLSMSEISLARYNSKIHIERGWSYLGSGNKEMARIYFTNGLQEFMKHILQAEVKEKDLLDITAKISPGGFGIGIPVGKLVKWMLQETQIPFRGVGKFVNIR